MITQFTDGQHIEEAGGEAIDQNAPVETYAPAVDWEKNRAIREAEKVEEEVREAQEERAMAAKIIKAVDPEALEKLRDSGALGSADPDISENEKRRLEQEEVEDELKGLARKISETDEFDPLIITESDIQGPTGEELEPITDSEEPVEQPLCPMCESNVAGESDGLCDACMVATGQTGDY